VLIEALRTFFPAAYEVVRRNPSIILDLARERSLGGGRDYRLDEAKRILEGALGGLSGQEREAAKVLLEEIFPQTKAIFSNVTVAGSSWAEKWMKEKRAASEYYMARYFLYAIPSRDVSDADMETAIKAANSGPRGRSRVEALLRRMKREGAARRFVEKLHTVRPRISSNGAAILASAMARLGEDLSKWDGFMFELGSTRDWWANEIGLLVRGRCKPKRRVRVASAAIRGAEPLPFAVLVFRYFQMQGEKTPSLQEADIAKLGRILAHRIASAGKTPKFLDRFDTDVPSLLWWWQKYAGREPIIQALRKWFQRDVESAARFVSSFVGYSVTMETGQPLRSTLDREQYN
jgi:hypothetical protein